MGDEMAVDGDMGLVIEEKGVKLVGKHVRPQVGMLVAMSAQGIQRREQAGRSDPSRKSLGTIVRVNANWTVDVKWHATGQTREGYACGCVARGGKTRAFHLAVIPNNAKMYFPSQEGNREMYPGFPRSRHAAEDMQGKGHGSDQRNAYENYEQEYGYSHEQGVQNRNVEYGSNGRGTGGSKQGPGGKNHEESGANRASQQHRSDSRPGSRGQPGDMYYDSKGGRGSRGPSESIGYQQRPLVLESQRVPFVLPSEARQ